MKKVFLIVTIIMVSAMTLSACSSLGIAKASPTAIAPAVQATQQNSGVIAEGHIEPKEHKYLSFPSGGRVAEILVEIGDTVTKGQVLARLENTQDAQARLDTANVDIAAAQKALDDLERTADLSHNQAWVTLVGANQALTEAQKTWDALDTQKTADDIESAKTEVADAEKTLNNAQDDFEPYKDLPQENSQRKSAQQTLDDAEKTHSEAVAKRDTLQNGLDLAQANLEHAKSAQVEAQHTFDQTQRGVDPTQLNLAKLRLQSAQAQETAAQAALDNLEIKAPMDGSILDINVIKNELVTPGSWVALMADTSRWYVRTSDLTELEVVGLGTGQEVEIVPDALSDLKLTGTVDRISNTFTTKSGDILYDVMILLNDFDPRLRWGMTVEATFNNK